MLETDMYVIKLNERTNKIKLTCEYRYTVLEIKN